MPAPIICLIVGPVVFAVWLILRNWETSPQRAEELGGKAGGEQFIELDISGTVLHESKLSGDPIATEKLDR